MSGLITQLVFSLKTQWLPVVVVSIAEESSGLAPDISGRSLETDIPATLAL
jgi:hypothetical protein